MVGHSTITQLIGYSIYSGAGSISPNELGPAFFDQNQNWYYLNLEKGSFEHVDLSTNTGNFISKSRSQREAR